MDMEKIVEARLQDLFEDEKLKFDKSRFVGGLTNYNYLMDIDGGKYVIRQPGNMTNLMINRKNEKVNNQIASKIGINSECIYFDDKTGMKVSRYIKKSKDIGQCNPSYYKNIDIVVSLIKKTHESGHVFPNKFNWLEELEKYESIVKKQNGILFSDYHGLKSKLLIFMENNLGRENIYPCHNDTVPENFLIDPKGRGYLIDWEYSGMNDYTWDLAAYILEGELERESIDYFLESYYGKRPEWEDIIKIKSYMMAQDLLWTVWAMIRHYSGEDFLDYCYWRYSRFQKNLKEIGRDINYPMEKMVKKV